jgi:hypothetical protein
MKKYLLVFFVLLLAGCADSTRVKREGVRSSFISGQSSFYVALPSDGNYGQIKYDESGSMTTQSIQSALLRHTRAVNVAGKVEKYDVALKSAKSTGVDYLIYPTILHWEDRATEWNFLSDKINIKIEVTDVLSGQVEDTAFIDGESGMATFGGDHPQDLLAKPVSEYIAKLFGK